ncbi:diguanylate cyclase [Alicyclobacillaceae bacterium I2511]|nr:diguanylate cyclase [Alicyclobacillaceae bacterium I2511]
MGAQSRSASVIPILAKDFFQSTPDLMFVMGMDTQQQLFHYLWMNPAAMAASGLNEMAYGATFKDVVVPEEAGFLHTQYFKAATQQHPASFLMTHAGKTGHSLLTPMFGNDEYPLLVAAMVRDVTELLRPQRELEHLAYHDPLTGLFNRHALPPRFAAAKALAEAQAQFLSVILLDCDNLKPTNDTYGHLAGDLLLKEITRRIQKAAPQAHTLVRTGGDEFLVAALATDEWGVLEMAERLLDEFRHPWVHEQIHLQISVSMGLAIYPVDGGTLGEVMGKADKALYIAKENGGNQYMLVRERKG